MTQTADTGRKGLEHSGLTGLRVAGAAEWLPACQDLEKKQKQTKKAKPWSCSTHIAGSIAGREPIAKPLLAASSTHIGQDRRHRPWDRHKPEARRKSTKHQAQKSSMSSMSSRPASHSGRYKKRARQGSWPLHGAQAKATATPSCGAAELAKKLAEAQEFLAWEQGRRLSLEGSQASEKHMRLVLRGARCTVCKMRAAGEISSAVAQTLLQCLSW